MKHVVCYSGGHSSALVAIEVTRKFGAENVILLNHDIHASVENPDIKRFKADVAKHLGLPITYANMDGVESMDQFDVVVKARAFKVGNGEALCSNRLKTQPFHKWLKANFPVDPVTGESGCVIYYGFDANERRRITRRSSVLGAMGYRSDYPLALWTRTIQSTREVGIEPPLTYGTFKHANCTGCLKAGMQHWYAVFCTRPDIWNKAKAAEDSIGYTIIRDYTLEELEPRFELMRCAGVKPTEHINQRRFWIDAKKAANLDPAADDAKPCECVI